MTRERRFGRPGRAATVVSAGALVLLVGGAPPAHAAAPPRPCPKVVDPASALKHLQCQLERIRKQFTPKPKPQPQPKKTVKKGKKAPPTPKSAQPAKRAKTTKPSGEAAAPSGLVTAPRAYTGMGGPAAYRQNAPAALPAYLPAPEIAARPGPAGQTVVLTGTRLIAPVAASGPQQDTRVLWAALAAGTAGAVGAMNLSVMSRSIRRRRTG